MSRPVRREDDPSHLGYYHHPYPSDYRSERTAGYYPPRESDLQAQFLFPDRVQSTITDRRDIILPLPRITDDSKNPWVQFVQNFCEEASRPTNQPELYTLDRISVFMSCKIAVCNILHNRRRLKGHPLQVSHK